MIIKLVEVKKIQDFNTHRARGNPQYELDEIWINPTSIVQIKTDLTMKNNLNNGYLPEGLDSAQDFSRIHFGTGNNINSVTVVGAPDTLARRLHEDNRQLLKG
jgi:hypothetical protein